MEKLNLTYPGALAQSFDPAAFAKMKADTINNTPGDLTGHDCAKCLNRGTIAIPRDDGSFFTRECDCMKIRRCVWKMEASGLKNIIKEKTFDTFHDKDIGFVTENENGVVTVYLIGKKPENDYTMQVSITEVLA